MAFRHLKCRSCGWGTEFLILNLNLSSHLGLVATISGGAREEHGIKNQRYNTPSTHTVYMDHLFICRWWVGLVISQFLFWYNWHKTVSVERTLLWTTESWHAIFRVRSGQSHQGRKECKMDLLVSGSTEQESMVWEHVWDILVPCSIPKSWIPVRYMVNTH